MEQLINKIKQIGYDRCGYCPAYWASVDYWGEGDSGCLLHRDIEEFCTLSFVPKAIVKKLIKKEEKRMDKHWQEMGDAIDADQREMEALNNALTQVFKDWQIDLMCFGNKVDLTDAYQLMNDIHRSFKTNLQGGD